MTAAAEPDLDARHRRSIRSPTWLPRTFDAPPCGARSCLSLGPHAIMMLHARSSTFRTTIAVAIVGATLSSCHTRSTPLRVVHNGRVPAGAALPLRLQPLDDPQLDQLAAREHLRDVAPPAGRQFDRILQVKEWVNAQWPVGTPDPYPPWNAMIILDWIRSGRTGGFCGQYSQVLLQSLAALGFNARYVEIGAADNPYAHYVTEVWSNDFDKWVMMDADYNLHFERDGVPMSALEIHDALLEGTLDGARPVAGTMREGRPSPDDWPQKTAEFYRYLRYHLKANHLTKPGEAPFDRFNDMMEFVDPRVVPWERSPVISQYPKERLTNRRTGNRDAVSAPLNQVRLDVLRNTASGVVFGLRNSVMQLDRYEFRIVDAAGGTTGWQSLRDSRLEWPSPEAGSSLEVRGVNVRDVAGPIAKVAVDAPALPRLPSDLVVP